MKYIKFLIFKENKVIIIIEKNLIFDKIDNFPTKINK